MDEPPPHLSGIGEAQRAEAMRRFAVLRPHLEDGGPLSRAAAQAQVAYRTAQRWLSRYRAFGLAGLASAPRRDRGTRRFPAELIALIARQPLPLSGLLGSPPDTAVAVIEIDGRQMRLTAAPH